MNKKLFATISVARENDKRDIKIYKTKDEKFGVEVEFNEGVDSKKIDNITADESKIDNFLNILVNDSNNFDLLEDYASDYNDVKQPIEWL